VDSLRALDASERRPPSPQIAELCEQHPALWQRFHEWLATEGDVTSRS
jgi:hypothetical protein